MADTILKNVSCSDLLNYYLYCFEFIIRVLKSDAEYIEDLCFKLMHKYIDAGDLNLACNFFLTLQGFIHIKSEYKINLLLNEYFNKAIAIKNNKFKKKNDSIIKNTKVFLLFMSSSCNLLINNLKNFLDNIQDENREYIIDSLINNKLFDNISICENNYKIDSKCDHDTYCDNCIKLGKNLIVTDENLNDIDKTLPNGTRTLTNNKNLSNANYMCIYIKLIKEWLYKVSYETEKYFNNKESNHLKCLLDYMFDNKYFIHESTAKDIYC